MKKRKQRRSRKRGKRIDFSIKGEKGWVGGLGRAFKVLGVFWRGFWGACFQGVGSVVKGVLLFVVAVGGAGGREGKRVVGFAAYWKKFWEESFESLRGLRDRGKGGRGFLIVFRYPLP